MFQNLLSTIMPEYNALSWVDDPSNLVMIMIAILTQCGVALLKCVGRLVIKR